MYEVTIKKREIVDRVRGGDWAVVDQRPFTTEDVNKNIYGNAEDYKGKVKDVYGYTPKITKKVEVETEVLKQTVDDLDFAAVIRAINGI